MYFKQTIPVLDQFHDTRSTSTEVDYLKVKKMC